MSTAEALGVIGFSLALLMTVVLVLTRARLRTVESRLRHLEREVRNLEPSISAARDDARSATLTARRAAAAAGAPEELDRMPLEPVTGRIVRAVSLGAGASRALVRLARPRSRRRES